MNLTSVRVVQNGPWRAPAWSPAFMAQAAPASPALPAQASLFSIDGPVWAVAADVVVVTSTITLARSFGFFKSRWSSVFWGLSAVAGFKTLLDLSRIYR